MRRLTLAALLLLPLLLPSGAAAKETTGAVVVSWNGVSPADTPAGGTWRAAFTLGSGPGDYYYYPEGDVHPVLVITGQDDRARRIAARPDGQWGNAYVADVRFPEAGTFRISVTGFDARRPERISSWGSAHIRAASSAASSDDGQTRWPWVLAVVVLLGGLLLASLAPRRSARA